MAERIHKDFHGLLNYGLKYIEKNYGQDALHDYLVQLAKNVYGGFSQRIRKRGLKVLEKHSKKILDLEGAEYEIHNKGGRLILNVKRCPALEHMRKRGYPVMKMFCKCDNVINEAICRNAGIKCKIRHNQGKGSCIQEFWKADI